MPYKTRTIQIPSHYKVEKGKRVYVKGYKKRIKIWLPPQTPNNSVWVEGHWRRIKEKEEIAK